MGPGADRLGQPRPAAIAAGPSDRRAANLLREEPTFLRPGHHRNAPFTVPTDTDALRLAFNELPLTPSQRESLNRAAQKSTTHAHALQTLVEQTAGLSPADTATVLGIVAEQPSGAAAACVRHLAQSDLWNQLAPEALSKLVAVMDAGDERGLRLLARLVETKPEALTSKDAKGATLLSNLALLATQPMSAPLYAKGLSRDRLVQDVLRDVTNPDHIEQGTAPTCTVTSMQFELARDNPAEYTRLLAGLCGPSGTSAMKGGGHLGLERSYILPGRDDDRAVSEVLFQSAAMEFANGTDEFLGQRGTSVRDNGSQYKGLYPSQQRRLLENLFGVSYTTDTLDTPARMNAVLSRLKPYVAEGTNRPVLLEIDEGSFNHVVTYERMRGNVITYRDPYGRLGTMTESSFRLHVVTAHLPNSLR